MKPRNIKKIVFFETVPINKVPDSANSLFIALNPAVHAYLKSKGLPVQNTLPYFGNDSHKAILEKSKAIVEWLRKNSHFIDFNIGIEQAYKDSFIFWIRFTIHYCLWTIEIIQNAINIHQPEILAAYTGGKKRILSFDLEPKGSYLGYLVKTIAQTKNLEYENIFTASADNRNLYILKLARDMLRLVKFISKDRRSPLYEGVVPTKNKFDIKKGVLFATKSHNMDKLAQRLQKECPQRQFYFLKPPPRIYYKIPKLLIKLFWRRYLKDITAQEGLYRDLEKVIKKEGGLFSYRGISFASVIVKNIEDSVTGHIRGLALWTVRLNHFMNTMEPSILISNAARFDNIILTELCQRKKIPTVLISHGSHVRPKDVYERIEWGEHGRMFLRAPFEFLALQSPISKGYLDVFPTRSKVVKTGPLTWGLPVDHKRSRPIFEKLFNNKYEFKKVKVVLHAATPKPTYFMRPHVYETPDEYIESICSLAKVVEKLPDTVLVIKLRPYNEISVNDLKSFVPFSDKVVLSVDESFLDVLGMADLLVSFSSTAIDEALQNRIPVLLFGGKGRYQHVPAYEINSANSIKSSAVYHVKEAEVLEYAIGKILGLNIDGSNKDIDLFKPYIYPEDSRTSLVDLLKT